MRLAVIPARGGSKRIPRKNIRPFLGRPIIHYAIDAALQSGLFDAVVVSTDDEHIAEVAKAGGASVPFLRPVELADDFTGTNDVARHAIAWFREQGHAVESACCIYATAPFVTPRMLREAYAEFADSAASFVFTVTTFPSPIQRALRRDSRGVVTMFQPEHAMTRSQDLEEAWHDAGQFYWGRADAFLRRESLFAGNALGFRVPRERVQDIDTEADWSRAELLYRLLQESGVE